MHVNAKKPSMEHGKSAFSMLVAKLERQLALQFFKLH